MAATGFLTNKATLSNALLVVVVVGESLLIKVNWFLPTVRAGVPTAHLGGGSPLETTDHHLLTESEW